MFSLTNIGLSMCVKEYSDLFLNFWHSTYPVWREKDVITHVLLMYPAQGEKFRVALMLSQYEFKDKRKLQTNLMIRMTCKYDLQKY
jgi:hypothetical protein